MQKAPKCLAGFRFLRGKSLCARKSTCVHRRTCSTQREEVRPVSTKLGRCFFALAAVLAGIIAPSAFGQALAFTAVEAEVDFSKHLRVWDGFGFNYVETAQTYDYPKDPQDYGGFSLLKEEDRQKVIELVFGENGLKVSLVKMFLDPFHQTEPGGKYDHETTTKNMRAFVREGLKKTRAGGRDLTIITTLYGPPAYMTKQKVLRGRDLDPAQKRELARYLVEWVKFLREKEGFPVKYVSLHNEGEDWARWTQAGLTDTPRHDYNLFWPPAQVVEFIKLVAGLLKEAGLGDVGVTPGETTNWYRFGTWGYADALADDAEALEKMGLITSHGFFIGQYGRWYGEPQSAGIDLLRARRPELRAWVTSASWSLADAKNIKEHHGNIYSAKVNGIIPAGPASSGATNGSAAIPIRARPLGCAKTACWKCAAATITTSRPPAPANRAWLSRAPAPWIPNSRLSPLRKTKLPTRTRWSWSTSAKASWCAWR